MLTQFGTNIAAARIKRVYYTETSSTIYEGMPVCYEFDATTNVLGYDKGAGGRVDCQSSPESTAEGNQNEGKYLRVEDVDANNVEWFAGVVAGTSEAGKLGGRWLDIYVPNGAIVPVRTDLNCLIGQTILAITTASQELGVPLSTDSRPVAIAVETVDRGTAGIVLAKLDPTLFIYQDHGGTPLSVDDADTTTGTQVNHSNIKFLGSSIYNRALYMIGEVTDGAALNGMFKFRTYVSGTMDSLVQVVCANLHIKDDGVIVTGSGEWNSAFYGTVETETTTTQPDLSGGKVAGIQLAYYVDETTGAPARAAVIAVPAGLAANTYAWDALIWTGPGHLGDSLSGADEASHVIGFDGDGVTRKIPIYFGEDLYYFLVGTAIQGVTDA